MELASGAIITDILPHIDDDYLMIGIDDYPLSKVRRIHRIEVAE